MWLRWRSKVTSLTRDFSDIASDPVDFQAPLRRLKEIRCNCEIQMYGRRSTDTSVADAYRRLMVDQLKRVSVRIRKGEELPILEACIQMHHCFEQHVRMYSLQTRLVQAGKVRCRIERLLWRSFQVVGASSQRRVWNDIGCVLHGQVMQFMDDYELANL